MVFNPLLFRNWKCAILAAIVQLSWYSMCAAQTNSTPSNKESVFKGTLGQSADRFYSEAWSTLFDDASSIATFLAICAGGAWAYFNFINGRVYRSRLELSTSAVLSSSRGSAYLLITSNLKNVGLSKVAIVHEGTVTRVSVNETAIASDIHQVDWRHVATFGAFGDHDWIESGELIQDQRLFVLPNGKSSAYRIETRVTSKQSEWNATSIISHADDLAVSTSENEGV